MDQKIIHFPTVRKELKKLNIEFPYCPNQL